MVITSGNLPMVMEFIYECQIYFPPAISQLCNQIETLYSQEFAFFRVTNL